MTSDLERLGAQIQAARKRKRLTQFELAERVDVSSKTISAIERGIQAPGWDTLTKLARDLGLEVQLVDSSGAIPRLMAGLQPDEAEVIAAIAEAVLPVFRRAGRRGGSAGGA